MIMLFLHMSEGKESDVALDGIQYLGLFRFWSRMYSGVLNNVTDPRIILRPIPGSPHI